MKKNTSKTKDVENFEKRREQMREESSAAHHDGAEYPSSDDVLRTRGERGSDSAGVPEKDGDASDAETSPDELHGSLHGRWSSVDDGTV